LRLSERKRTQRIGSKSFKRKRGERSWRQKLNFEILRKKDAARIILCALRRHIAAKKLRQLEEDLALKKKREDAIKEKGLYRAFCRVRPSLGDKSAQEEKTPDVVHVEPAHDIIRLMDPQGQKSAAYMFDRVFGALSSLFNLSQEASNLKKISFKP
jgi:hypothetical protein